MFCQAGFDQWRTTIMHHLPHLSKPQATVLALWSLGMVLARSCALTAVSAFLARGGRKSNTVRQQLREWCYEAPAKRGAKRQALRVETCFAPLLGWVLQWWQGTQLAMALDATDPGTPLCGVGDQCGLSRLCHSGGLGGACQPKQKHAWRREWLRLLRRLRPRRPPWLDGDRVGGSGLVCALAVSAHRALGLASVLADQHGRHVSACRDALFSSPASFVPQPGTRWRGRARPLEGEAGSWSVPCWPVGGRL